MKAEELVTKQFQEAKVAWKKQKNALEAQILSLQERLVGKALGTPAAKVAAPRTLEPGLKKGKPPLEETKAAKKATKKGK